MKGQDIILMLLLRLHDRDKWKLEELSSLLGQSVSQCHAARNRLREARLLSADPTKPWHVPGENFAEYLIHGFKYDFPPKLGAQVRGIPTAQSSEFVAEHFRSGDASGFAGVVWPSASGTVKGQSLAPVHSSQLILHAQPGFEDVYKMLVYMDLLRVGQARERAWAANKIEEAALAPFAH
jgi:hypothetical protein